MSLPASVLDQRVADLVTDSGGWNLGILRPIMGAGVQRFFSEVVPRDSLGNDYIRWLPTGNGEFSVKSAYNMIVKSSPTNRNYKAIWKLKVPEKVRLFVWRLSHDRLLTRERCSCWFGSSDRCHLCPNQVESTLHVLRDCSAAASLWNKFLHPRHFNVFYNHDFSSWLSDNLSNKFSPVLNFNWNQIWATITWSLWRWRNDSLFNSSSNIPRDPYLNIYSAIQQYNECLDLSIVGNEETVKTMRSITWKRPEVGWIKLNTDGSCDVSRERSGCGGLLRNSDGVFVMGFAKFLGNCSVLRAEAYGLLEGLQCASEIGIAKLQIECD